MTKVRTSDVLLVDFADAVRSSMPNILRMFGYTVVEADDGDIALELLSHAHFAMIILDLDLPRRSGIELLASVSHPPPTVIISAGPVDLHDWERVKHKVAARLRKPVPPELLIESVRTVLQGGKLNGHFA